MPTSQPVPHHASACSILQAHNRETAAAKGNIAILYSRGHTYNHKTCGRPLSHQRTVMVCLVEDFVKDAHGAEDDPQHTHKEGQEGAEELH